jgi:histidyl-tRNA synthetase
LPGVAGVGISFGVDRIFDVMEELQLFPPDIFSSSKVLFFNLGKTESHAAFDFLQELRHEGISSQLYHENAKLDKQFKYATKKNIPFVVIIGSKELEARKAMVKSMVTNEQQEVSYHDLILYLKNL